MKEWDAIHYRGQSAILLVVIVRMRARNVCAPPREISRCLRCVTPLPVCHCCRCRCRCRCRRGRSGKRCECRSQQTRITLLPQTLFPPAGPRPPPLPHFLHNNQRAQPSSLLRHCLLWSERGIVYHNIISRFVNSSHHPAICHSDSASATLNLRFRALFRQNYRLRRTARSRLAVSRH